MPVIETVLESYRIFFQNFRTFIQLFWPSCFALVLGSIILGSDYILGQDDSEITLAIIFLVIFALCGLLIVSAISAWHRLIVLGRNNPDAAISLRFGRREWTYYGYLVAFLVFSFLMIFGIHIALGEFIATPDLTEYSVTATLYSEALFQIPFFLVAGLLLILPSKATGIALPIVAILRFWKLNLVRIWGVFFLVNLPGWLIGLFIDGVYAASAITAEGSILDVHSLAVCFSMIVFIPIDAAAISLVFKQLLKTEGITYT